MIVIKTTIGIAIILIAVIATYVIGVITRRITESRSPSTWEWETTMIAGLMGWMVIGVVTCVLGVAALLGEVVIRAFA